MAAHQDPFEAQCRGAISLVPVYFTIDSSQVRTQSDAPLQTILGHVLHQLVSIADADLSVLATPDAEIALVQAVYDKDTLPLVLAVPSDTGSSSPPAAGLLGSQQKARLLVEGIAGAVSAATQLAKLAQNGFVVDKHLLSHELDRLTQSGRQQHIRTTVEHSHLFNDCLMVSQILDLIMDAASNEVPLSTVTVAPSFDDYCADVFCSDSERTAARNMGVPEGFSFMVLN